MSRPSQRGPTTASSDEGLHDTKDDICPVCKSSRYLNPNMRLLVNPECWHRMCESCVSRIFGKGPANCPIAGCKKTLRKHRFRKQTFEDIQIEREVDIRREIAEVMNRREEEFETLRDYNDYLEQYENITFNLISGIDVAATRRNLERHRAQNQSSISANRLRDQDERAAATAQAAAEREAAKMRRKVALREAEDEKRDDEESRREIVDQLARGEGDADTIARQGAAVILKRKTTKRQDAEREFSEAQQEAQMGANGSADAFVIRGLKKHEAPKAEVPYSPFAGVRYQREYFVPQEQYSIGWLDKIREDDTVTAGGYDVNGYCQRALVDAFSGLGVFVADEVAARADGAAAVDASRAGTSSAAEVGGGQRKAADDVF